MKKILSLGADGSPVLRLPGGKTEAYPLPRISMLRHVFLLVDCSTSMSGAKLSQAQAGGLEFAQKAVSANYAVGLIGFASTAKLLSEPSLSLAGLQVQLSELRSAGSTNVTAALELAIKALSSYTGTRAIVLATDGAPDDEGSALAAAAWAKELGMDVITIGTDDADRAFLRRLASRTDLAIEVTNKMLAGGIPAAVKLLTS